MKKTLARQLRRLADRLDAHNVGIRGIDANIAVMDELTQTQQETIARALRLVDYRRGRTQHV